MSWDDYRYLLELSRHGSASAAASICGVSRTTVSRRIAHLESRLNCRLFDRLPNGHKLTSDGADIVSYASEIESLVNAIDLKAKGRDETVEGNVRVSLPLGFLRSIAMSAFSEVARSHPMLQIEILTADEPHSIAQREVDIAVHISRAPAPELVGRSFAEPAYCLYASRNCNRPAYHVAGADEQLQEQWGWPSFSKLDARLKVRSDLEMIEALILGGGVGWLPCFVGDAEPELARKSAVTRVEGRRVWVVTHKDLKQSRRIRIVMDELYHTIDAHRRLIEGRSYEDHLSRDEPTALRPTSPLSSVKKTA